MPASTMDPPYGIDVGEYDLGDVGVGRARWGKGVLELEVSVRTTRSNRNSSGVAPSSSAAPTPVELPTLAGEPSDLTSKPTLQRALMREDTIDDSTATDETAQHTKESFQQHM